MKRFPHGIDITAPGGLTALMAFHRLTFGDAVMEVNADDAAKAEADAATAKAADKAAADAADEKLGEGGVKALKAEREARAAAEKELAEFRAERQKAEDAKLSDIQKAQKERDDEIAESAKLKVSLARLTALAEHPVPKEYQHLVTGTDADSFLASAKSVSELAVLAAGKGGGSGVVHKSGSRSGEGTPSGGSLTAGRDLYASRKNKK